jgi:CheY-like chemotaxis protein
MERITGEMPKAPTLDGSRILIVDNEQAVANLLELAVREAGAEIVGPADNAGDALRLIEHEQIDAALVTMILSGAYCDSIAAELERQHIPFAITTGIGVDATHPELKSVPIITKPFQALYVQQVLAQMLR